MFFFLIFKKKTRSWFLCALFFHSSFVSLILLLYIFFSINMNKIKRNLFLFVFSLYIECLTISKYMCFVRFFKILYYLGLFLQKNANRNQEAKNKISERFEKRFKGTWKKKSIQTISKSGISSNIKCVFHLCVAISEIDISFCFSIPSIHSKK